MSDNSRSVYVANLPEDATTYELEELFSDVGEVSQFHIVRDRPTGKSRRFGFCRFRSTVSAKAALEGRYTFRGTHLIVRPVREHPSSSHEERVLEYLPSPPRKRGRDETDVSSHEETPAILPALPLPPPKRARRAGRVWVVARVDHRPPDLLAHVAPPPPQAFRTKDGAAAYIHDEQMEYIIDYVRASQLKEYIDVATGDVNEPAIEAKFEALLSVASSDANGQKVVWMVSSYELRD